VPEPHRAQQSRRSRAQQMLLGHVPIKRKLVEQRVLLDLLLPHHRLPPSRRDLSKSNNYIMALPEFFNTFLQLKAITAHVAQNQSGRRSASDARNASRRSSAGPRQWPVCVRCGISTSRGRLADSSSTMRVTNPLTLQRELGPIPLDGTVRQNVPPQPRAKHHSGPRKPINRDFPAACWVWVDHVSVFCHYNILPLAC
jgi:hypothetical protein